MMAGYHLYLTSNGLLHHSSCVCLCVFFMVSIYFSLTLSSFLCKLFAFYGKMIFMFSINLIWLTFVVSISRMARIHKYYLSISNLIEMLLLLLFMKPFFFVNKKHYFYRNCSLKSTLLSTERFSVAFQLICLGTTDYTIWK